MPDDLRARIAAAVSGVDDWRGVTDPAILADAVIRELGLKRDQLGADIGYPHQQCRYVTEWMSDE